MINLEQPWEKEVDEVLAQLKTDKSRGLSSDEAQQRLENFGPNKITQTRSLTFWDILWEEIREPMILLLIVLGVAYSIWGKIGDTITIIFVILSITLVEVFTEYRAKKNLESLRKLALPTTWVIRDGAAREIHTTEVVQGDILILNNGVRVGADAMVIQSNGLEVDESQLTGESIGVAKKTGIISANSILNDRSNMVHMGSVILKGRGYAVVTSTGMQTELGRIAGLTQVAREPKTPLQLSMKQLSKSLIWLAVGLSILIPLLGLLQGMPPKQMILTGLSLAFATIPEEMPIIVTMLLGLGAISLLKKHVLIKRTKAAETLGSVTVIATDKTGTLTENKMSLAEWAAEDEQKLFCLGTFMADISYDNAGNFLGDPMDKVLVDKAQELGINREDLFKRYQLIENQVFDEGNKLFRSTVQREGKVLQLLKGAPESILAVTLPSEKISSDLNALLAKGYRVIAFASKEEAEKEFHLDGLVAFADPLRPEIKKSVLACRDAGVRVIMITGDHAVTASRIAQDAGLQVGNVLTGSDLQNMTADQLKLAVQQTNVFARITPEQKLEIVKALRDNGEVIAVTGDGINDAPALKAADIGISLGISGTDVAKETADMVLTNDSFSSIVEAIKEGRKLHDNLSKGVKYYLACKLALVISLLIPVLFRQPMPFAPIQIIILELFMDLAASTSFVAEPAESDLLKRSPQDPHESFMNKRMLIGIFGGGLSLALVVLLVFFFGLSVTKDPLQAQTFAFTAWLFGHLALALNLRTEYVPISRMGVFSNKIFNGWMIGIALFLILAVNIPWLRGNLKLTTIHLWQVLAILGVSLVVTFWLELRKILNHH